MFPFILAAQDWQQTKLMFGEEHLAALCKVYEEWELMREEGKTHVQKPQRVWSQEEWAAPLPQAA